MGMLKDLRNFQKNFRKISEISESILGTQIYMYNTRSHPLNYVTLGEDRPSTKDLHNHVVQGVAGKWRDAGVQLLDPSISDTVLDITEIDHPQDSTTCCKRMFRKWLDTKPDASWSQLLNALRSPCVQLNYLADQIDHQ